MIFPVSIKCHIGQWDLFGKGKLLLIISTDSAPRFE